MADGSGRAKIKVIGVGGGGNNAVNRMIAAGIKSAEFVAVNTDFQALTLSNAPTKVQIGAKLTGGLGAGADPNVGEKAAEESREELRALLKDVDLLFITAGMGGGTGTGAAPVIAALSKELGILTVAVVTKPFAFEGKRRMHNAVQGIENLRGNVDTLLVIPNEKLLEVLPKGTAMLESFIKADEVLKQAIQSISELIVTPTVINLDFADISAIMRKKGLAHMGIGVGEGPDKAIEAVRNAVESPLLETNIEGASGVILHVMGGKDMALDEVADASRLVEDIVDPAANIIFGTGFDENLENKVQVTLIATGFSAPTEDANATYAQRRNTGTQTRTSAAMDNAIRRLNDSRRRESAYDDMADNRSGYTQYPESGRSQGARRTDFYEGGRNDQQYARNDQQYPRNDQQYPRNDQPYSRNDQQYGRTDQQYPDRNDRSYGGNGGYAYQDGRGQTSGTGYDGRTSSQGAGYAQNGYDDGRQSQTPAGGYGNGFDARNASQQQGGTYGGYGSNAGQQRDNANYGQRGNQGSYNQSQQDDQEEDKLPAFLRVFRRKR